MANKLRGQKWIELNRQTSMHVDFMSDIVVTKIKLKKYNCDPFYLVVNLSQELIGEWKDIGDRMVAEEIASIKEKDILVPRWYRELRRKRRHDFITHGKHGLKRPKHG